MYPYILVVKNHLTDFIYLHTYTPHRFITSQIHTENKVLINLTSSTYNVQYKNVARTRNSTH